MNNNRLRRVAAVLCVALGSVVAVSGRCPDSIAVPCGDIAHRIGVELRSGWVPPTNSYLRGFNKENRMIQATAALHLRYDFSFSDKTRYGRLYPGVYQGSGVGVNTFMNHGLMGTPVSVYVLQGAPIVHFSSRLWLGYEWNFGAAFGWKSYDDDVNDQNLVIGSSVTAYIDAAFTLNYQLSPCCRLWAGLDGAHYSNGNTSWPNAGVNTLGLRLGLSYVIGGGSGRGTCAGIRPTADDIAEMDSPKWSYDVIAYGAARKAVVHSPGHPTLVPGHFGVAGVQFAPMRRFCRYFRAGLSVDIQYDESSNLESHWVEGTYDSNIKFTRPGFFNQTSAGISARAELTMPVFSVNVGFGRNLLGPVDSRKFYQVLALKTFVTDRLFLHVGYQLSSFKDPNNLMLGIGYRFH